MTKKQWRKIFLPSRNLDTSPLKPKASVVPMSYTDPLTVLLFFPLATCCPLPKQCYPFVELVGIVVQKPSEYQTVWVPGIQMIVTWFGRPFEYQTFWTINRLLLVWFWDHHLNTKPFDNQTQIYHLNTILVRYSDGYSSYICPFFTFFAPKSLPISINDNFIKLKGTISVFLSL